jgi:hypothetical protein
MLSQDPIPIRVVAQISVVETTVTHVVGGNPRITQNAAITRVVEGGPRIGPPRRELISPFSPSEERPLTRRVRLPWRTSLPGSASASARLQLSLSSRARASSASARPLPSTDAASSSSPSSPLLICPAFARRAFRPSVYKESYTPIAKLQGSQWTRESTSTMTTIQLDTSKRAR